MNLLIGIIATLVIFAVIVIAHEGGHFVAAKAVGVKVNEFAMGMGPLIFSKTKGETKYSLRLLPIGGYVAMEGDSPESMDSDDARAYNNKPAWAKALICFAGPAMNFILAVIILIGLVTYIGTGVDPKLTEVIPDQPAYMAGLRAGDEITAVDGTTYRDGVEMTLAISDASENSNKVVLTVKDAETGELSDVELAFAEDENGNKVIGVMFGKKHNIFAGAVQGTKMAFEMEATMIKTFAELFTGGVSVNDFMGPVGVVNIVDKSAQNGMIDIIYIAALLSLNLGIINMVPFPALDGGRILFLVIRKIAGDRISDKIEGSIHFVGIVILFALMLFITFKDINTFILK